MYIKRIFLCSENFNFHQCGKFGGFLHSYVLNSGKNLRHFKTLHNGYLTKDVAKLMNIFGHSI